MFNDRFGLTQAVLDGRKTQTRRIVSDQIENEYDGWYEELFYKPLDEQESYLSLEEWLLKKAHYQAGEVVSVAQSHIKITDLRIERLQDISDEDCFKEGLEFLNGSYYVSYDKKTHSRIWLGKTPQEAYAALIDKISGNGTWEHNPLVWVYEFELID